MHALPLPFPTPLPSSEGQNIPLHGPHPDMVSRSEPLWHGHFGMAVCGPWVVCGGWPTGVSQLLMQIVPGIPDTAEPEVTYAGH